MRSLAGLLFEGAPTVAVHDSHGATSRQTLAAEAQRLASAIAAAGVAPGAPVAVTLPNRAALVAALFGVWRAGAVYVPVNPRLTPTEVERVHAAVRPAAQIELDGDEATVRPHAGAAAARHDSDVALISFTSGTTGPPKPVLLRHSGVLALLDGVIATLQTSPRPDDRPPMPNLVPVSLSLWAGIYQVLFAFRVGAPVVLMDEFATARFAALVGQYGIRSTVLPPAAMTMLSDDESITSLAPLKYVRSISAPLSPLQARRFQQRFGISVLNGYGQTEIGGEIVGWSAADSKEFGDAKLGSVGRPHDGVTVRTVSGDGADTGVDEPGELWVRTPALGAGYADGNDLGDRLSPDGWFRTGDIARVDADGFVWIEGRVSDMINRGGLKVFPDEVAEVLRLDPAVADAAVIGVADDRLGEVPWGFVVAAPGRAGDLDVARVTALCRRHLAPYKIPVGIDVVAELPRNEIGKVVADELRAVARTRPVP